MRKLSNKRETEIRSLRKDYVTGNFDEETLYKLAKASGDLLAELTRYRNSEIVFTPESR